MTGPYVRFPEYTNPRPSTSGFNPSDKVVTRVARLYYFRDAHRVAQIINRKVRSYNRQGVDIASQLADTARGQADAATDARRRLERAAVRAARAAREAENRLQRLQGELDRARRRQQSVKQELDDFKSDLQAKND